MADTRVFISYDQTDQEFARQLAMGLKMRGVNVMPDSYSIPSDRERMGTLAQAEWLLLVRSPHAKPSERVQNEVGAAMDYTISQQMQGVLSISPDPFLQDGPPTWSVIRSFTTTAGYERSLDALVRVMSAGQQAQSSLQISALENRPSQAGSMEPVDRPGTMRRGVRKLSILPGIVLVALVVVLLTATVFYISSNKNSTTTTTTPASPVATSISNGTTATTSATATPIANPQKFYDRLQSQKPVLDDPMNGTGGNKWSEENTTNGSSCTFEPDKLYHNKVNPSSPAGSYNPCVLQGHSYINFAYQASMKIVSGDAGGLIFRADQTNQPMITFYRLSLDNAGHIAFVVCTVQGGGCQGNYVTSEGSTISLPVSSAPYQPTNILAVIASGTTFYFFVNQKLVTQVDDVQIKTGGDIGLYAASVTGGSPTATDVAFSDVKVWSLHNA